MPLRLPIPVVLLGRTTAVGKPVSQFLRPEYEVIHFITSDEAAYAELPRLLAGQDPQAANPNDIGTRNYTEPPRVLIFGRGYTPELVKEFQKACAESIKQPVAWVVGDPAKMPTAPPGPGYAEVVTNKVKGVLETWKEEGGSRDVAV
ncbi:hypothetical protein BJX99DRAFT_254537 [Aspergillus californicus]